MPTDLDLAAGIGGNEQLKAVSINLSRAEKLVTVRQPLREWWRVRGIQALELQTLLVQVILIGDFPLQTRFT